MYGRIIGKEKTAVFGLGLLAGTAAVKILTSKLAKKAYVKIVATGLKAKAGCNKIIEEAKANADDIVAEAKYVNDKEIKEA